MSRSRLAAAIVVSLFLKKKKKEKVQRSCWVKQWILDRSKQGAYSNLIQELKAKDVIFYRNFLRVAPSDFQFLLELIKPKIEKRDTVMRKAITAEERLTITLRYLATGDSYQSLQYLFRVPTTTISRIIPDCCKALYECLKPLFLKVPSTEAEWYKKSKEFEAAWNFPHCIGALDGKHITIQAPNNSGSLHFNYKGFFSIVLMALVDANYNFIYIDIGAYGRISDGGVFTNCSLSTALQNNVLNIPGPQTLPGREKPVPFVIVADDAFAMTPKILKPFPFKNQPVPNRIFNYRLSRARRVVENAFGHIASRFRVLRTPIKLTPERTKTVVSAICVLHNYLINNSSAQVYDILLILLINGTWWNLLHILKTHLYFSTEFCGKVQVCFQYVYDICDGEANNSEEMPNNLISIQESQQRNLPNYCKEIRDEFKEYFMTVQGEVPWQYEKI